MINESLERDLADILTWFDEHGLEVRKQEEVMKIFCVFGFLL